MTTAVPGALPVRVIWPWQPDFGQHRLPSGHWVSIQQLRPSDAPALATAVEKLSAQSRYWRFHSASPRLTEQMIAYLTNVDHHDHEALVAFAGLTSGTIVGVARFIRDPAHPNNAEVAVAVADSWQRRGLATLLLHRLIRRARDEGISSLTGYILTDNYPTMSLFRRLGPRQLDYEGSTVTASMNLDEWAVEDPEDDSLRLAVAAAEVVQVPLAILAPAVIHLILDVAVDVITACWATPQCVDRPVGNVPPGESRTPSNARAA